MSIFSLRPGSQPGARLLVLAAILLHSLLGTGIVSAGEVTTEYGFVIEGTPIMVRSLQERYAPGARIDEIVVKPLLLVDDGMRRNFLSKRIVPPENINTDTQLEGLYETFKIEHVGKQPGYQQIDNVGPVKIISPLNEYGRRAVQVQTPTGSKNFVQMITEINPRYVKWETDKLEWKFAESTTSIPTPLLDAVLRHKIDPHNEIDRMSIARFYLQTYQFHLALSELFSIKQEFPAIRKQVDSMEVELMTVWANQMLRDLEFRRLAGQHHLALLATEEIARTIPNLKPEVTQKIRELQQTESGLKQQMTDALLLLGDYQSQLKEPKLKQQVNAARTVIASTLDKEGVPRLQSFLNLHDDESLSVDQKLALAISGWILGSTNANTDLENTLRQWEARNLILAYLRNTDPTQTVSLLEAATSAEGISTTTLVPLLEHLPAIIDTPGLSSASDTGQSFELETYEHRMNTAPAKYSVVLPIEYSPHHSYPLIVELRPPSVTRDKMMLWWKSQAERRGYIVIAPEYLSEGDTDYNYSTGALDIIERSIRDTMRRFNIDSNRIFIAGHGVGGDAALDFGLSHPDLFAGVISISGLCRHHCTVTKDNDPNLSFYVVAGEKDPRQALDQQNSMKIYNRWMVSGRDIIYVEYMGRGIDDYYEEIHRLFDWMELQRLDRKVTKIDVRIVRPNVSRFYWLESNSPDAALFTNDPLTPGGTVKPMPLNAEIKEGNDTQTIYFNGKTPDRVTLWLTPDVIDFSKRVSIRGKGRITREFLEQDVRAMLEDFHARADRQSIARTKLVLD